MRYDELSADEQAMQFELEFAERGDGKYDISFANKTKFSVADLFNEKPFLGETIRSVADIFREYPAENLWLELKFDSGNGLVADEYRHVCADFDSVDAWKPVDIVPGFTVCIQKSILNWIGDVHAKIREADSKKGRRYDLVSGDLTEDGDSFGWDPHLYDDAGNLVWQGNAYEVALPMDVKLFLIGKVLFENKTSYAMKLDEKRDNCDKRVAVIQTEGEVNRALRARHYPESLRMQEKYVQAIDHLIGLYEAGNLPVSDYRDPLSKGSPPTYWLGSDGSLYYYNQTAWREHETDAEGKMIKHYVLKGDEK